MKKRKAVFDVDDILWGLNERVAKIIGYDINLITNFSIRKCNQLDADTQERIISLYSDIDVFNNMDFYDGAEDLLMLEDAGIDVSLCSNSMTKDIADSKAEQLLRKIRGLRENQLQMNIISEKTHNHKEMDSDIWVLVDDSPYNIANSKAEWDIMRPHPWNQSYEGKEIYKNKKPIIIPTLMETTDYIYKQAISF